MFFADPGVHYHTEPLLFILVTQGCHLKCSFNGYFSRKAVEGRDLALFSDATLPLFDEAPSDSVSYIAHLSAGTRYFLASCHPGGLARALRPTVVVCYRLTHLKKTMCVGQYL